MSLSDKKKEEIISAVICDFNDLVYWIKKAIFEVFGEVPPETDIYLDNFLNNLNPNMHYYVEAPYVDKFYRDTYYLYYSTKHRAYSRYCIRVSLFSIPIKNSMFRETEAIKLIQQKYCGYFVIRPTFPKLIGRTAINPSATKLESAKVRLCKNQASVNGVKFEVDAYPYSSQDEETTSCAEITLWNVLEYFSSRYQEYSPVLPSQIIKCLSAQSYERQTPSHGLVSTQIAFTLKSFGFGTQMYMSNTKYEHGEFFRQIFYDYILSGIPFIAIIENEYISHAISVIGQESISDKMVMSLKGKCSFLTKTNSYIDLSDIARKFVAIDDNHPPYSLYDFNNPLESYNSEKFKNTHIAGMIVPLFNKVYLDAINARRIVKFIIEELEHESIFGVNNEYLKRIFLTSSRSFKSHIANSKLLNESAKNAFIKRKMPKFVWVCELSTREKFIQGKALGLIVLDATEPNENIFYSLIFVAINGNFITQRDLKLRRFDFSFSEINLFNNLSEV
ncbi:MAG: hypothetical protein K9J12_03215 [Melioribacteraceae bacterium]|nr:hypothetical protein [Melioribacteraceae bacterium]MCF8266298.1 hypothetical protein [Melioribacteraceae bacterium]MCF8413019.1 hypothetical protein [Melioribacteraceae bacterium]